MWYSSLPADMMLDFIISLWQGPSSLAYTLTLQILHTKLYSAKPNTKIKKERNKPLHVGFIQVSHSPRVLMLLTITSHTIFSCTNKFQMSQQRGEKGFLVWLVIVNKYVHYAPSLLHMVVCQQLPTVLQKGSITQPQRKFSSPQSRFQMSVISFL